MLGNNINVLYFKPTIFYARDSWRNERIWDSGVLAKIDEMSAA